MKKVKYQRRDQIEAENKRLKVENAELKQQVATLNEAVIFAMTSLQTIRDSWKEEILENKEEN